MRRLLTVGHISLSTLDTHVARAADHLAAHHDGLEDGAGVWAQLSEPAFAGVLAVLLVVAILRRRLDLAISALLAGASAGLALGVTHVVSVLVDRPRPFVSHPDIQAFIHHAADASFPSDHATAAFAIAGAVALRHRVPGLVLLGAATALAVSRVLLGLHYPADVLAGACIGLGGALTVARVWSWAAARRLAGVRAQSSSCALK